MSLLGKIFGTASDRHLRSLESVVVAVNELESQLAQLLDADLRAKTADFRRRLGEGATLDDLLPEAFAVVRESAKRTLKQRHFDVQILGGIILHQGKIAEMKTGEGKTLVTTLAAYLNALPARGVHVVTVNDYLARRDAVWMGQIYDLLGLSVGVINHEASYRYDASHNEVDPARDQSGSYQVFYEFLKPCTRREAYEADITYGTNNEFGFDYLRDNLAHEPSQVSQIIFPASPSQGGPSRPTHHFAIVDEVDSVLIDEARTPLIISAPIASSDSLYLTFAKLVETYESVTDYVVDEKLKTISVTEAGIARAERALQVDNLYTDLGIKYVHHLETALRAKALFNRDHDYVVKNGEIIIVDEFTGRLQPGRRWSDGLHQAIEAKERVAIKDESRTYASVTLQNYFKLYGKLAGMTGTALTSAEEFHKVYGLEVMSIPTNRSSQRADLTDLVFQTEAGKLLAVARRLKELHLSGQPVLVGTVSIEKNELVSAHLKREGVPHRLLNAKNHEEEGAIIAEAGRKGSVVIATNLAGRGVDIKLGGALATAAEMDEVRRLGGLFVLGTERHEARRIDNQLRGRSGRQGDPGTTQFYISFDDNLARVFVSDKIKGMMRRLGVPEDQPIENRLVARAIESAQGKIEGFNFDLRHHLLEYDTVLNHQRVTMYRRRQEILFGNRLASIQRSGPERQILLQSIDRLWVDHLEAMDYLKQSVRLRAYGQRDPFVEYKREGLQLFKQMEQAMNEEVAAAMKQLAVPGSTDPQGRTLQVKPIINLAQSGNVKKVGRNDLCPCGSGKKYKKCHGK
ncbi:MAG: preprotein translocase subunit SecA [Patescibacteria group bacterium]